MNRKQWCMIAFLLREYWALSIGFITLSAARITYIQYQPNHLLILKEIFYVKFETMLTK